MESTFRERFKEMREKRGSGDKKVKEIEIENIIQREPFNRAFELEGDEFDQICLSMGNEGYSLLFPVFIWNNDEGYVLIDGHRRVAAAVKNGIRKVPAEILLLSDFANDDEVLAYIKKIQYGRRNVPESIKFKDILDSYLEDPEFSYIPGVEGKNRLRDRVGRFYGMSPTTAARWLKVIREGEEYHSKILKGLYSVNAIFKVITEEKKAKKDNVPEDVEVKKRKVEQPKEAAAVVSDAEEKETKQPKKEKLSFKMELEEKKFPEKTASIGSKLFFLLSSLRIYLINLGAQTPHEDVREIMNVLDRFELEGVDKTVVKKVFDDIEKLSKQGE